MNQMDNPILHVEDSPDDVTLLAMAFRKANVAVQLDVAADGERAIDYFEDSSRKLRPRLVLLDLKVPRKSGFEVLAWLRSQPHLKRLPVIILTSSNQPEDIELAYDLGVNSY